MPTPSATAMAPATVPAPATAPTTVPVLMISVDGMKPDYVLRAAPLGLQIPFLREMLAGGTHARGVVGVWPTVTYPSHTTLLTGVSPAVHGILNNSEFDPRRQFADSWYWYAHQIRVSTLWQAAHNFHLSTASVGWPVSVGATDVDYLIPEYWRISHPTADLNASDAELIADLSRPEGALRAMELSLGPYLAGNDTSVAGDETKTRFAVEILRAHQPKFMTVHLSSLDEIEHEHGPFSPEADRDMEAVDAMLMRLATAARAADPAAVLIVVSDHGFVALTHRVNLAIPFAQAGLIQLGTDPEGKPTITAWDAQPWSAGGMAAIMLRAPNAPTRQKVAQLLQQLAAQPAYGIGEVLDADAARQRGAFPGAAFLVVMKPGYYVGGALTGEATSVVAGHGGHGFAPSDPSMQASFFASGSGIARQRDLGIIDMRQIAPTIARLLNVELPDATARPLALRQ